MSQQNVEVVRRCIESFARRDLSLLTALIDPAVVLDLSRNVFNSAIFEGHDGVRRFFEQPDEMWEDFEVDPEELLDGGDQVVVALRMSGKGREGVAVEDRIFQVWDLRDGKVVRLTGGYRDRAEALEAAGLPE